MARLAVCFLAMLLACATLAASAIARNGTGLYEPFPEGASKARAKRYLDRLPVTGSANRFSEREIERGVLVDGGAAGAAGVATARGGRVDAGSSLAPALQLALLLLPLGAGLAVAARRS